MSLRDKMFLAFGTMIGVLGVTATLLWSIEIGVVALLLLGLIILVLVVLQRRQLSRVQQRTLTLLNARRQDAKPVQVKPQESLAIPTKKVVGLLQAQQMSMDLLNEKLDRVLEIQTKEKGLVD